MPLRTRSRRPRRSRYKLALALLFCGGLIYGALLSFDPTILSEDITVPYKRHIEITLFSLDIAWKALLGLGILSAIISTLLPDPEPHSSTYLLPSEEGLLDRDDDEDDVIADEELEEVEEDEDEPEDVDDAEDIDEVDDDELDGDDEEETAEQVLTEAQGGDDEVAEMVLFEEKDEVEVWDSGEILASTDELGDDELDDDDEDEAAEPDAEPDDDEVESALSLMQMKSQRIAGAEAEKTAIWKVEDLLAEGDNLDLPAGQDLDDDDDEGGVAVGATGSDDSTGSDDTTH